ncbi:MAG: hypothetical protein SGJ02_03850, partial [bacterium]|nr:hypothetical protein [bacterium]
MNIVSTTKSHPAKIALIAATILILELVFIRQLPAENHSLSYFTNLILMSSFFGLGIGCILEKKFNLERLLPIGLVAVFFFLIITRGMMVYQDTTLVHFWLQAVPGYESALKIPMFLCVVWAFISCLLPFIALGQYLIREMNQHSRLKAYSWDIIGSLIGTILFATASYFELPPWLLVTIVTLLASLLFIQQKWIQVTTSLAGLLFLYFFNTGLHAHWSPYYLVQHAQRTFGTSVWVNSSFHQYALDFVNPEPVSKKKTQYMLGKFSTPYNIYKEMHSGNTPETVLVLGAGTGNDLNIALLNEAKKITAVEIDPAIQRLGTKINTLKPYSDPKVTAIIDDARHFLRTSKEKFDLIVFGTLDSQTLLSGVANLRLENFVYTKESFEAAKSLLNDKGMVVVYYSALKPWLLSRIYTTMREVFGEQLRFLRMNDAFLFNSIIIAGNNLSELKDDPVNIKEFANNIPLSDNWPYLYLEKATIAPIYQSLFLVLLGLVIISFFV